MSAKNPFSAFSDFLRGEMVGGIVLMIAAALALIVANSLISDLYFTALQTKLLCMTMEHWVNDGLIIALFYTAELSLPALTIPMGSTDDEEQSPLHRLEHGLAKWVGFVIVPVFGFANAGVSFGGLNAATVLGPLPVGIALGLFLGKFTRPPRCAGSASP